HATEVIGMSEKAANAVRSKRDSSMRVGLRLVREGRAAGFVTAGNTGAAMATAKMVLGALPGVDRPALAAVFPTSAGKAAILHVVAPTTAEFRRKRRRTGSLQRKCRCHRLRWLHRQRSFESVRGSGYDRPISVKGITEVDDQLPGRVPALTSRVRRFQKAPRL